LGKQGKQRKTEQTTKKKHVKKHEHLAKNKGNQSKTTEKQGKPRQIKGNQRKPRKSKNN